MRCESPERFETTGGPEDGGERQEGMESVMVRKLYNEGGNRLFIYKVTFWQSLVKHCISGLAAPSPFCLEYLFNVSKVLSTTLIYC